MEVRGTKISDPAGAGSSGFRWAPPTSVRDLLIRPRLLAPLLDRFRTKVTVVRGAPGFGKTSLLAQAYRENLIAQNGVDVWLTCQPGDAMLSTLGHGIAAALQVALPEALDPQILASAVAAEVWRRSPDHVALIFDDAHLVPPDSPGAALLGAIVHRLPSNGHVLLAGRAPLPLPTARLAARGELVELAEAELGFSDDEAADFASLRGVPRELIGPVAPWPALAELTASTGRRRVTDYVWEEVLSGMPPDRRRLLAVLAAVGGADDETYAALFDGRDDLAEVLAGLPLVDGAPGSWRSLHPLWESALAGELSAGDVVAAKNTVASVLLARGQLEQAVRHYLDVASWEAIGSVVCELAKQTHPLVAPDVLAQWLAALPPEWHQRPEGLLLAALIERSTDLSSALVIFTDSARAFRDAGNPVGEFSALTHLAHISWWIDDRAGLEAAVHRIAEVAATAPSLLPRALLGHVLVADTRGEFERAWALLERLPAVVDGPNAAATVGWLRAWILLMLGRPERARSFAALAAGQAIGTFRATGVNVQLLASWWSGDVDAAIARLPALSHFSDATGRALGRVFERSQCAALLAYTGDVDGARHHLAAARASLTGAERATMAVTTYVLAEAALALVEGREESAGDWLRAEVGARGVDRPGAARVHRLFPALSYVLVPESREQWARADLGPTTRLACDLAAALVALREGDLTSLEDWPELPRPGIVRAVLPLPWAAELAAGLTAVGRAEGASLVAELGRPARSRLKALAVGGGPLSAAARELLAALPAVPLHRLAVRMLGTCELLRDSQRCGEKELQRLRVRQLLAYLVVRPVASRQRVAAALWPDLDLDDGLRNLRVTLNYLQRALEPDRADGDPPFFLRADLGTLSLRSEGWLSVDVWSFDELLDEAAGLDRQGAPSLALERYRAALELYRDDFGSDAPDVEWVQQERDRLRGRYVTAGVRAGELLVAVGRHAEALELAHAVLRVDRWSESAYQLRVVVHLEHDQWDAARMAYRQCLHMLRDLGVEPSPKTRQLERRLGRVARAPDGRPHHARPQQRAVAGG